MVVSTYNILDTFNDSYYIQLYKIRPVIQFSELQTRKHIAYIICNYVHCLIPVDLFRSVGVGWF